MKSSQVLREDTQGSLNMGYTKITQRVQQKTKYDLSWSHFPMTNTEHRKINLCWKKYQNTLRLNSS